MATMLLYELYVHVLLQFVGTHRSNFPLTVHLMHDCMIFR